MHWTTPTLVEICIALDINGYLPAEFLFIDAPRCNSPIHKNGAAPAETASTTLRITQGPAS
jgi:hypothetical protein